MKLPVTAWVMLFALILSGFSSQSQVTTISEKEKPDCKPTDIFELIFRKSDKPPDTSRHFHAFLLPYVAYSPTKAFQVGLGGTLTWYSGISFITKQSAASATVEITTNRQKLFQLKTNVYTNRNRWFLQGDWRFYIYSLPTFGLGTGYNDPVPYVPQLHDTAGEQTWNQSYLVKFRWIKLHEVFSYRIMDDLYAGVGYHLDYHYRVQDTDLRLDSADPLLTPHFAYSVLHGFNPERYTSSGISMNLVFDTRDNLISPYKGFYANVRYRYNFTWLGSSKEGSQLWTEFRTYVGLEKKLPRHLIAFWLWGGFQLSGEIPYFDLWATGFDQMNSSGRGYLQGRWRGENVVYAEVEYRFPISRCSQVLGGVIFTNVTTASSRDQGIRLFSYFRPAGGIGLRITVSKMNRTNILIDFTLGEKSKGVYFSAQEAF